MYASGVAGKREAQRKIADASCDSAPGPMKRPRLSHQLTAAATAATAATANHQDKADEQNADHALGHQQHSGASNAAGTAHHRQLHAALHLWACLCFPDQLPGTIRMSDLLQHSRLFTGHILQQCAAGMMAVATAKEYLYAVRAWLQQQPALLAAVPGGAELLLGSLIAALLQLTAVNATALQHHAQQDPYAAHAASTMHRDLRAAAAAAAGATTASAMGLTGVGPQFAPSAAALAAVIARQQQQQQAAQQCVWQQQLQAAERPAWQQRQQQQQHNAQGVNSGAAAAFAAAAAACNGAAAAATQTDCFTDVCAAPAALQSSVSTDAQSVGMPVLRLAAATMAAAGDAAADSLAQLKHTLIRTWDGTPDRNVQTALRQRTLECLPDQPENTVPVADLLQRGRQVAEGMLQLCRQGSLDLATIERCLLAARALLQQHTEPLAAAPGGRAHTEIMEEVTAASAALQGKRKQQQRQLAQQPWPCKSLQQQQQQQRVTLSEAVAGGQAAPPAAVVAAGPVSVPSHHRPVRVAATHSRNFVAAVAASCAGEEEEEQLHDTTPAAAAAAAVVCSSPVQDEHLRICLQAALDAGDPPVVNLDATGSAPESAGPGDIVLGAPAAAATNAAAIAADTGPLNVDWRVAGGTQAGQVVSCMHSPRASSQQQERVGRHEQEPCCTAAEGSPGLLSGCSSLQSTSSVTLDPSRRGASTEPTLWDTAAGPARQVTPSGLLQVRTICLLKGHQG